MSVYNTTDFRQQLSDEERAAQIRALLETAPLPMIEKSIEAFRRDLPEMLKSHRGRWVAYHGDERIGFGNTQTELVQECFQRGLTRDDFVVCGVEEGVFDPDEDIEISPDV
jgi:hypothetical protein